MPFLIAAALAGMALPFRLPSHEAVRSRILACGIANRRARFEHDPVLQEDVVRIAAGPVPPRARLDCLARVSLSSAHEIAFDDPRSRQAYGPAQRTAEKAYSRSTARAWLRAHGLLAGLPRFVPATESVVAFAHRLESHCGVAPGAMLALLHQKSLTIRTEAMDPARVAASDKSMTCVIDAVFASNLSDHGVEFGFVGNEAETPAQP